MAKGEGSQRDSLNRFMHGNREGEATKYDKTYPKQAEKLCALGATDAEIADFFEVHVSTIYRWKASYQPFCDALTAGKEQSDERVVRSLYQRAVGYEQQAVKFFMPAGAAEPVMIDYREHIPADVTAATRWLYNRRPEEWRDAKHIEATGKDGAPLIPTSVTKTIIDPKADGV